MSYSGKNNKGGAPKKNKNAQKPFDWGLVDKLLLINASEQEIADILGVCVDTITNRCKKDKKMLFSDYIKRANADFKISLKRLQYRSARGLMEEKDGKPKVIIPPSVTMQIWLGKQYLNQRDRQEIDTNQKQVIEIKGDYTKDDFKL